DPPPADAAEGAGHRAAAVRAAGAARSRPDRAEPVAGQPDRAADVVAAVRPDRAGRDRELAAHRRARVCTTWAGLAKADLSTRDLDSVALWWNTGDCAHETHIRRLVAR